MAGAILAKGVNFKKTLTKNGFLASVIPCLFVLLFVNAAYSVTYNTIADGNWNSASTWDAAGIPPTASNIPASDTINIRHTVTYNTGNPIKNDGTIRIQSMVNTMAALLVPTNINVENFAPSPRGFYVIGGAFLQCRFVPCNDGQPYSGNNPGAAIQSGTFKNIGGYVELKNANVEVAQDWTSESGGTRLVTDSCVTTGQNFSVKGSGTNDTIIRSHISIGWHASGNFELADGSINFDSVRIQLAGTSGSVKLDSGTANGDIDYITLRNHVVPFIGGGEISASSSLSTSGLNLDAYCVSSPSKYIPNGKFSGSQTSDCTLNYFPPVCSFAPVLAANASIEGRVLTAKGKGISGAIVELSGGDLPEPIQIRADSLGKFIFEGLPVGQAYVVTVYAKQTVFSNPSRVITLQDNLTGFDFIADARKSLSR